MQPIEKFYLTVLQWGVYLCLFLPLFFYRNFLNPFVFGRALLFRSMIEILFIFYLLLIVSFPKYRPRRSLLLIAITVYMAIFLLASLTGVDFSISFWGTLERMGGFFTLFHFWLFFLMLISVFRTKDDWLKLLKISVLVSLLSSLFALGQKTDIKFFIVEREKIVGTLGNAALFAGYTLFNLFYAFYFFIKEKNWQKYFFGLAFIIQLIAILLTRVRGSIIAVFFGLFFFGFLYLFNRQARAKGKKIALAGLIIIILLVSGLWLAKDTDFVQSNSYLKRVTDISLKTETVQTRFWAWGGALKAFQEKPILGWGPENFDIAFAKYFNPKFFKGHQGEYIWDRAHNHILNTAAVSGSLGLLSYLFIWAYALYLCFFGWLKKEGDLLLKMTLGVLLISYFIHDLFIFDTFCGFLMLFLYFGLLNFLKTEPLSGIEEVSLKKEKSYSLRPNSFLVLILVLLVAFSIYQTNIKPAQASYLATRAKVAEWQKNHQLVLEKYQEALDYQSFFNYEIRHKLAAYAVKCANEKNFPPHEKKETLELAIGEIKKNIAEHPANYLAYLHLGKLNNVLAAWWDEIKPSSEEEKIKIAQEKEIILDEGLTALKKALELSPGYPRILYELGQNETLKGNQNQAIDYLQKAVDLNPAVPISWWYLGIVYANKKDYQTGFNYIDKAIEMGYDYKNIPDLMRLITLYAGLEDYLKIAQYYHQAIEIEPNNAQFYASLAMTYAKLGQKEEAIKYARQAAEIDPENFKEGTEIFIQLLEQGEKF